MAKKVTVPYFTQLGLAKRAKVGKTAVAQAIARGTLAVVWTADGVSPLIDAAEADRWLRERKPAGRPKKAEGA